MTDRRALDEVVAEAVRRERAGRRWTQEALAEKVGWARATVADLEGGRRRVTLDDVEALCAAFDVPLRALLLGERGERARRVMGL